MKLGLVAHNRKKVALDIARDIITLVNGLKEEGRKVDLVISENDSAFLSGQELDFKPVKDMNADAIITVGGDGTLLRTLQETETPILGINAGSLGFLTEVMPEQTEEAVMKIMEGEYQIEERSKLKTVLNGERLPDSTNEAVVSSSIPSKIQEFEFYIDMEWVQKLRADGIIISTPTGSTSYALSAGGCVLDPRLEALEIIPISPFRINSRPIIIPDVSVISMKITHRSRGANLVLDGYYRRSIKNRDEILFTGSKDTSKFIRFDMNFYRKFSEKIIRERPVVNKKGKY